MARKRIFISHSTKADEPEAAAFLDVIRNEIRARPDAFELKVDLDLQPGTDWRNDLYTWMDEADGAVVIIGRNALTSNFVPIELSFLSIRAELSARDKLHKDFPLIPVLLPGITRDNVKTGVAGALDLKRFHFVREETAEASATKVIERLLALFDDTALCLSRWQNGLIGRIGNELAAIGLDQAAFEEAGAEIGWEDVRRSFRTPAHLRLAAHLALATPDEAGRVLYALQRRLAGPSARLQNVYRNLCPQWVLNALMDQPADALGRTVLAPRHERVLCLDLSMYRPDTREEAFELAACAVDGARRRQKGAPTRPCIVPPPGREAELSVRLTDALLKLYNTKERRLNLHLTASEDPERLDPLVLLLDPDENRRTSETLKEVRSVADVATLLFVDRDQPTPADLGWLTLKANGDALNHVLFICEQCEQGLALGGHDGN